LLERVAERAGDRETVEVARRICRQERAMGDRLEQLFDRAAQLSLRDVQPENLEEQLVKYLADAHAIEEQSIRLLERGRKVAGDRDLGELYASHLEESRQQQRLIALRLEAHRAKPSGIKDAAMRLGALNWGGFFQAQPDTPGKLAAFAYAFEHLEIGGYEQLVQVARKARDDDAVRVVDLILAEERAMGEAVAARFDQSVEASLEARGVAA
jgi:ferritin-like metal-binding protein YciE